MNNQIKPNSFWKSAFKGMLCLLVIAALLFGLIYGLSSLNLPWFDWMNQASDTIIITVLVLSLSVVGFVIFMGLAMSFIVFVLVALASIWMLISLLLFPILFPFIFLISIIVLFGLLLSRRKKQ